MRTTCARCFVVVMLMGVAPARAEQTGATVVRAIQVVEDGGFTNVTIDADGALQLPLHESLDNPPRIYFDLAGVSPKISGITRSQKGGVVSRVRVALHSVSPRVTRIVLDLTRPEGYRVSTDELRAGRIRVIVGGEPAIRPAAPAPAPAPAPSPAAPLPSPPAAPVTPPPPVAPARNVGTPAPPMPAANPTPPPVVESPRPPAPKPSPAIAKPVVPTRSPELSPEDPRPALPPREIEAYRKQVSGQLARMQALRALVAQIDAEESIGFDTLASAVQEFTNLRRILESVRPSGDLAATHDLLMTSCSYGAMASRLGIDAAQDGKVETRQRAASAAAGSLMLFDRACTDLGCAKAPR